MQYPIYGRAELQEAFPLRSPFPQATHQRMRDCDLSSFLSSGFSMPMSLLMLNKTKETCLQTTETHICMLPKMCMLLRELSARGRSIMEYLYRTVPLGSGRGQCVCVCIVKKILVRITNTGWLQEQTGTIVNFHGFPTV